jgi:hypothetical protein
VFFLSLEQVAVAAYISVMEPTLLSKHQASTGFSEIALNATEKETAEHVGSFAMAHVAQAGSMYWLIVKKFRKLKICRAIFLKKAFSSLEGNELHFLQQFSKIATLDKTT